MAIMWAERFGNRVIDSTPRYQSQIPWERILRPNALLKIFEPEGMVEIALPHNYDPEVNPQAAVFQTNGNSDMNQAIVGEISIDTDIKGITTVSIIDRTNKIACKFITNPHSVDINGQNWTIDKLHKAA